MTKLEQAKNNLKQLVDHYNQLQAQLNTIGQAVLKAQGRVDAFRELEEEAKVGVKKKKK